MLVNRGKQCSRFSGYFEGKRAHFQNDSCSVEKIKEQVMGSFDDAHRFFNWGRAAALALPFDMIAG
jgi:hypothetical protein